MIAATPVRALLALLCLALAAERAHAVAFQAELAATTHQLVPGDTYADRLAAHQAGALLAATSITAFEGVSAPVEAAGPYVLQVGTDPGRGGVAAIPDGSAFQPLDEPNLDPLMAPEPHSALLTALGLVLLAIRYRSPRA